MRPLLAALLTLLAVCGGQLLTVASGAAPGIDKPEPWGTLKGRVVWADLEIPEPKELEITRDKKVLAKCLKDGNLFSENRVINKDNRGIRWVYVWLAPQKPAEVGAKPVPLPIHPDLKEIKDKEVVIDVPCCQFVPHAVAVRRGQVLLLKNSAVVAHNFHLDGGVDNPGVNVLIPPDGERVEVKDLKAAQRPIVVTCGIHMWMRGWVRVFDHPYFAITDADGKFEIKKAPAGEWRLFIWQEETGWLHKGGREGEPIAIKAGQTKDLGDIDVKNP